MIDILNAKPILRVDLQPLTSNTIATPEIPPRNHKRNTTSAVILWCLGIGGVRKRGQHVVQPHLPATKTEEGVPRLRGAPDGGGLPAVAQGAYVDAQEMGRHMVSHLGPDC